MRQRIESTMETPMTFGQYKSGEFDMDDAPPVDSAEELDWLMSLALDDALDDAEAERLEWLLSQEEGNQERWATWQVMNNNFRQMPHVLPPEDFYEKFTLRLELEERRRRLRTGIIFGIAAAALWGSALIGIGALGALIWSNQADWMASLIHNVAYWWVAVRQFGQVVWNTVTALGATPQARAAIVCYIGVSMAISVGWFAWLRTSTREVPLSDAQLMKA